jgi:glycosyltransferase involved in cell wall biosynthesis
MDNDLTNKDDTNILIIVPAFNESNNITKVVNDIRVENNAWDILVVNDCSSDNTKEIAERIGKIKLINLCVNLGIGGAVQTGFIYARDNNYDIAIQFDGDGQHRAKEINKLIEPIINNTTDVVIGSRFLEENNGFKSTKTRRIGILIFQFINSIIIMQKITDNTSGFRAYNRKAIEFLSCNYPMDYPEPESIILLKRNQFKIIEIPSLMNERCGGKSSISGITNVFYMNKVILSVLMSSIRPKINN